MSFVSRLLDIIAAPVAEPKPDDTVVVALPANEGEGALWKGMLEHNGIECMLRDVSPLYRGYLNWAPEMELDVCYRDLERAREILGVDQTGVLPSHADRPRHLRGAVAAKSR
ncbi:MAG TPA: hypothetical protein VIE40_05440 [Dehalococcoidia bacterium]